MKKNKGLQKEINKQIVEFENEHGKGVHYKWDGEWREWIKK
jgi:hypothetical protein